MRRPNWLEDKRGLVSTAAVRPRGGGQRLPSVPHPTLSGLLLLVADLCSGERGPAARHDRPRAGLHRAQTRCAFTEVP